MDSAPMNNPNATERTKALYQLLQSSFGRNMLLAQQEVPGGPFADREIDWIGAITDDSPAIRGLDFIHDDYAGVTERAMKWNDRGGIVTICWHTGIVGNDYLSSKEEIPEWEELFTPGTAENGQLMRRWETAAEALRKLLKADIPVLWRPFHEFDGQWFWWGKNNNGEAFVRLWRMMYRQFTEEYGLNNLIWVLGYADDVKAGWDPGEAFFDIAGSDTYRGETIHRDAFLRLKALYPRKMLAFHECGLIPEPDAFFEAGCIWSWLMPWHSRWLMNNHPERIRQVYRDERMITLKRLPAF